MKVKITQEHINMGQPCDSHYCPIALALIEHNPNLDVGVGLTKVSINKQTYLMDRNGIDFVYMFDKGLKVEPIEIELTEE